MRCAEFGDAGGVAIACKACREKNGKGIARCIGTDQARAKGNDIGIIMFARQPGPQTVRHERAARSGVAIDCDRNADARSAHGYTEQRAAVRNRGGEPIAVIGIVDRSRVDRTEIGDRMALHVQPFGEHHLHLKAGVIGRDGNGERRGAGAQELVPADRVSRGLLCNEDVFECHRFALTSRHRLATKRFMKTLLLLSAAALALAGCSSGGTNTAAASNTATITNMDEANVNEADVTEVPDESADANAAQDVDDADLANEAENSIRNAEPATPLPTTKGKAK